MYAHSKRRTRVDRIPWSLSALVPKPLPCVGIGNPDTGGIAPRGVPASEVAYRERHLAHCFGWDLAHRGHLEVADHQAKGVHGAHL